MCIPSDETTWELNPQFVTAVLRKGVNVIAVEVHRGPPSSASPDEKYADESTYALSFDAEFTVPVSTTRGAKGSRQHTGAAVLDSSETTHYRPSDEDEDEEDGVSSLGGSNSDERELPQSPLPNNSHAPPSQAHPPPPTQANTTPTASNDDSEPVVHASARVSYLSEPGAAHVAPLTADPVGDASDAFLKWVHNLTSSKSKSKSMRGGGGTQRSNPFKTSGFELWPVEEGEDEDATDAAQVEIINEEPRSQPNFTIVDFPGLVWPLGCRPPDGKCPDLAKTVWKDDTGVCVRVCVSELSVRLVVLSAMFKFLHLPSTSPLPLTPLYARTMDPPHFSAPNTFKLYT